MRASFAVAFFSVISAALAQLQVNTPAAVVQCQPVAITYSGGTAPYFLSVIPGGQAGATPLVSFPSSATTTAGSYTWTVNIASGTSITFQIRDNTGTLAYSAPVTIQAGTDSSCLTSGGSSAAAGGVTTSAAAGASSARVTSSAAVVTTPSTSAAAAGTTTTSVAAASSAVSRASSAVVSAASSAAASASASAKSDAMSNKAVSIFALLGAAVVAIAA